MRRGEHTMSKHWPDSRASSLPELVHGEHVMRRPVDIKLTPAEQATYASWSRRTLSICAVIIASVIAYPAIQRALSGDADVYAAERPREPACAHWDDAARDAITGLIRGRQDADLRQVGDAVFRMRRARRNCHTGWVRLACLDYYAVIYGQASRTDSWPPASFQCDAGNGGANRNVVTQFDRPTR
jgi:hypothetical protein